MARYLKFTTNYILFTLMLLAIIAMLPLLLVGPFLHRKVRMEFTESYWWEEEATE